MDEHRRGNHTKKEKGSSVNKLLIVLICVLVAAVLALVAIFVVLPAINKNAETPAAEDGWYDPAAEVGNLPGKTQEEIQAELNRVVEEGMFNISIASAIIFEDGTAQGAARIENIQANHYNMGVIITLDDETEPIYESKGLAPGQYIENIKLSRDLPAGEYSATALFTAYTKEDLLKVGQAAAKITIIVEK